MNIFSILVGILGYFLTNLKIFKKEKQNKCFQSIRNKKYLEYIIKISSSCCLKEMIYFFKKLGVFRLTNGRIFELILKFKSSTLWKTEGRKKTVNLKTLLIELNVLLILS